MPLLTVSEVAEGLDVSPDTIRRWEKKGLIKGRRDKHNYRVFEMEEVERVHRKVNGDPSANNFKILKDRSSSGYTVLDLFSGAGGTALGLHNAGLEHVGLVELDHWASETLRRNMPEWNVIEEDIAKVDFKGINADVIEGGFPCQAFSYAGNKLGFEDTRGTLFFELARAVKEIRPKVAIGENVRGLYRHDGGRTLETMLNVLNELGYKVAYKVLRAQYLDVPQKRERLIIVAVREDLNLPILFPRERDYIVTLREAIGDVPESEGQKYPKKKRDVMEMIPPGGYWKDLPIEIRKEYMGRSFYRSGGKTGMARRLSWNEPCLTLTTSPAQKQTERCHPEETRPLTVREYARIQTFPDEWEFAGSVTQQYKQIGNALPVNFAFHVGKAVIAMLNKNPKEGDFVEVEPKNSALRELRLL